MLTDGQMEELSGRMGIPLEWIGFKSDIPLKIKPNKSYVVNMEDAIDRDGDINKGSHWVCFQVAEYPNGHKEAVYFDSYGVGPPEIVRKRIEYAFGIGIGHTTKNIQSLMSEVCGYYCLAFLHFINECPYRSGHLITDANTFMELFDDLGEKVDFKKNEYVLKHFFLSKDPMGRKAVSVIDDDIENQMEKYKSKEMTATL